MKNLLVLLFSVLSVNLSFCQYGNILDKAINDTLEVDIILVDDKPYIITEIIYSLDENLEHIYDGDGNIIMSYKWDESIDIEFIGGEVRLIKSSIAYKYDQYGEIDLESEYLEYYYDDSIYLKLRDVINF